MNGNAIALQFGPVSAAAGGALYVQIITAIKREIAAGRLKPHQSLPSVRALAAGLMVSALTVQKAYEELQRDGIVYGSSGLGTFVAEAGPVRTRQINRTAADAALDAAIEAGRKAAMSDDELLDSFKSKLRPGGNSE